MFIGEVTRDLEKGCTFLVCFFSCLMFILLHYELSPSINKGIREINKGRGKKNPNTQSSAEILLFQVGADTGCVWGLRFAEVLCCAADNCHSCLSDILPGDLPATACTAGPPSSIGRVWRVLDFLSIETLWLFNRKLKVYRGFFCVCVYITWSGMICKVN